MWNHGCSDIFLSALGGFKKSACYFIIFWIKCIYSKSLLPNFLLIGGFYYSLLSLSRKDYKSQLLLPKVVVRHCPSGWQIRYIVECIQFCPLWIHFLLWFWQLISYHGREIRIDFVGRVGESSEITEIGDLWSWRLTQNASSVETSWDYWEWSFQSLLVMWDIEPEMAII